MGNPTLRRIKCIVRRKGEYTAKEKHTQALVALAVVVIGFIILTHK